MIAAANPLRRQGGPRDAAQGRIGGGCRHRGADGADAGRAGIVRHRRRRIHAAVRSREEEDDKLRRPRDRACVRDTHDVSRRERQATREMRMRFPAGLSVGIPGVVAMLELAHKKYGKLPWATLFQPAIDLAEKGFAVPTQACSDVEAVSADGEDAGYQALSSSRRRHALCRRRNTEEPRTGGNAAHHRGAGAKAILCRRYRASDCRQGAARADQPGWHDPRRSCRI